MLPVLARDRTELLMQSGQSSPGFWLRRRLGLGMPEDTLNLPLDKKVGVNDNYALGICLGLVFAIITFPGPNVL